MNNMIFLGIYIFVCLVLFGALILSYIEIQRLKIVDKHLCTKLARIFFSILTLIGLFGAYMILTGDIFPTKDDNTSIIHL